MDILLKVSIVLVFGFIGGKLAKAVKLPSVSGYLIAGLLLGPSFINMVSSVELASLEFISEIALAVIAFSIGSEFSIKEIKKIGKSVVWITLAEVVGAVVIVFVVMYFGFKQDFAFSIVIASMSAATAPAATLMVIRQFRARGPLTKTILPVVALDDVFGIMAFGLALAAAKISLNVSGDSSVFMIVRPFMEIVGSLVLGAILGIGLKFASKKADNKEELQVITLVAIGVALGLSKLLYLSPLLTNIAMGTVLVNVTKHSTRIYASLNDFITPFYVLFFALAGASLDIAILTGVGLMGVAYIFARGLGKYLGARIGARAVKAEPSIRKYLGLALLPQGGVSIGLAVIVRQELPLYAVAITTIIMFSVLVYETTGPIFAKIAIKKAGEIHLEDTNVTEDVIPASN